DRGLAYGPAFRGLQAAWQHGDDIYADVALPESEHRGAFVLDPVLLDAAFHLGAAEHGVLPCAWSGVRIHATGESALRIRVRPTGARPAPGAASPVAVELADPAGAPVARISSVALAEPTAPVGAVPPNSLFHVEWTPLPPRESPTEGNDVALIDGSDDQLDGGGLSLEVAELVGAEIHRDLEAVAEAGVPGLVLLTLAAPRADEDVPGAVRATTYRALELVRQWLADERFATSRLVVLTRGAVATGHGDGVPDLVLAPVWGLIRAVQSEHPGRFVLADLDDPAHARRLTAALAVAPEEGELAVRGETVYARRLVRAAAPVPGGVPFVPVGGTVLVTGGTGGLGRLVAR
ncbi:polyketide synthase dehydratase domain-containing protein, partial [Streptomyces sp. NPDC007851]|uniref:SpnB-like Rossmann fold domain-containing protein n=1 Tax=Streptomyces sp. NPDC007851 TaxID=3155008 RepID=UPI0033E83349